MKDEGMKYTGDSGHKGIIDKMPADQSLDSIERSLPEESPESLLKTADRDLKRVGSESELY